MKKIIISIILFFCFNKPNAQINSDRDWYNDQLTTTPPPYMSYPFCSENPWILIFEDDFDGLSLNEELWEPIKGVPRDFTFQEQKAWHQPENVFLEDGILKIVSREEFKENMVFPISFDPYITDTDDFKYTTGEIWSKNKFMFGKYEAKIRIPKGKGLWPAFWLYGDDRHGNEVDIFEYSNYTIPHKQDMNVHFDYNEDGIVEHWPTSNTHSEDVSEDFHIYTLIYDKSYLKWYFDGVLIRIYYRYYNYFVFEPLDCIFSPTEPCLTNRLFPYPPMNVIFNTAIIHGGNGPDEETPFPVEYEVDWFRYYVSADYPLITNYDIPEYAITEGVISGYAADSIKICNLEIPEGTNVTLYAENFIDFSPEFEVSIGAEFDAQINNTRSQSNSPYTYTTYTNDSSVPSIKQQQFGIADLSVYPNPTTKGIIIKSPNEMIGNGFVRVYTSVGVVVSESPILAEETLVVLPEKNGMYIVGVVNTNNNKVSSYKIIKQ